MLYFTDKALNKLRKKAEKEYPAECCGILPVFYGRRQLWHSLMNSWNAIPDT